MGLFKAGDPPNRTNTLVICNWIYTKLEEFGAVDRFLGGARSSGVVGRFPGASRSEAGKRPVREGADWCARGGRAPQDWRWSRIAFGLETVILVNCQ